MEPPMSTEPRRILIINGHPDAGVRHLLHQLIDAYAEGAQAAGHQVRRVDVGALDFPLLRSAAEWEHGALPEGLKAAGVGRALAKSPEDLREAQRVLSALAAAATDAETRAAEPAVDADIGADDDGAPE